MICRDTDPNGCSLNST